MDDLVANPVGATALALLLLVLALSLGVLGLAWRWAERTGPALLGRAAERWEELADAPLIARLRQRFPRLWSLLAGRFSPESYLGLHLTLGLGLMLATLWAFVGLAAMIAEGEGLARVDMAVVEALGRGASPTALAAFQAITHLGDGAVLTVIGVLVGLLLLAMQRWLLLITWALALGCGGLLNRALKAFFQRARPTLPNPFAEASGWSFPSGHAMGSFITYMMLAYLAVRLLDRRWRRPGVLIAALLIFLIGLSRIYLGVHYVSDVLAGYAAGALWLAVCLTGSETARRWHHAHRAPAPDPAYD